MKLLKKIRQRIDNNPVLKPYLLMWLRRTTKTINKWPKEKFIKGVMECYQRHMGYTFDIEKPVTFTEKLQWYKVYYEREDFGQITDKVLFKEYIENKLGPSYTVPMYGYWEDINDLKKDWEALPETFVLKSNLMANSSGVIIIKKKSEVSFKSIEPELKRWLKPWHTLLNSWDWRFYNSTPKILAEKFLKDESGELRDYKFYCFDGYIPYFRVDYGRAKQHQATYFNSNFEEQNISVPDFPKDENANISLPENINELMELAKELSKGFPYIRIDFFSCNSKLYLSEFTFAPGGGVTHYPDEFNRELGDLFDLPTK